MLFGALPINVSTVRTLGNSSEPTPHLALSCSVKELQLQASLASSNKNLRINLLSRHG